MRDLEDFTPLMNFLKSYYATELQSMKVNTSGKKVPLERKDFVAEARTRKLDQFCRRCLLHPIELGWNLFEDKMIHFPPQSQNVKLFDMAREYLSEDATDNVFMDFFKDVCKFAMIELTCQPEIRRGLKKHIYEFGVLETQPTLKGLKELDVFHPSYRVKRLAVRVQDLVSSDM